MESLLRLDWPVPGVSPLGRRRKDPTVPVPCRPGPGALPLLIGSPGIKARGEGEWSARKPGASRPRHWCRLHPGIDAEALDVRAIEGELAHGAVGAMVPGSPSRWSRSHPTRSSDRSAPTGLATPGPGTPLSPPARPAPRSRPAATAGPGRRPRPEPRPATTTCGQAAAPAGRSGATGAATPDDVPARPRQGA